MSLTIIEELTDVSQEFKPYINVDEKMEELQQLLNTFVSKPAIVTAGIVKSGKSSLLNALVQKPEYFPTGAVRQTTANKVLELDDYFLVDTPGVNANQEDTDEAIKAYKQADLLLFVHNLVDGELQRVEVEFIKRLMQYFPTKDEFWNRFVFVGSNRHQLENEQVSKITEIIQEQIFRELDTKIDVFFTVDSVSYLRGMIEEKEKLLESSGISELLFYINGKNQELKNKKIDIFCERVHSITTKIEESIRNYLISRLPDVESLNAKKQKFTKEIHMLEEIKSYIQSELSTEQQRLNKLTENFLVLPSTYIYFSANPFSQYNYRSEEAAERAAKESFREKCYSHVSSKMYSFQKELINAIKPYQYYEKSANNPYFKVELELQKNLVRLTDNVLQRIGELELKYPFDSQISFNVSSINVNVNTNDILEALNDYDSCDWYLKANVDTYYITRYEKGWFGSEKEVEYYQYDFSKAKSDLEKDLNANIDQAKRIVKDAFSPAIKKFIRELEESLIKHTNKLLRSLSKNSENILSQIKDIDLQLSYIKAEEKKLEKAIKKLKDYVENCLGK